ncbi:AraC family transcriptional regulator [Kribbella sp. VKM Ac-2566]|uniref:helix-turn-helix domain-containing protein n=1 Tax=Kribbella sp. VKM Ac-2566 TaxID=2512218 RepID=UPI0010E1295F|nr:AraC family transcriptional regulator [Kribbella sp. VKM Ac-2566]TDW79551.1 AraC family transcriptional regulator [Kribbella sp. VKM Ac-2566]
MRTTFVPVGPALARCVDRIWTWEGDPSELPALLPGTGAELIFHRGSQLTAHGADSPVSLPRAHLLCMRRERWSLTADGMVAFTAIRLRAGALAYLTDHPVEDLIDRAVDISDLLGPAGRYLVSALNGTGDLTVRAARAEQVLRRQPTHRTDPRIMAAVHQLYRQPASTSLKDLAPALGVSTRHLRRGFAAAAGVSPKEFQRLVRFQRVIRTMLLKSPTSAAPVALAAGYYDQSHFIKEFHRLAGQSPGRMLSQPPPHFYLPSLPRP